MYFDLCFEGQIYATKKLDFNYKIPTTRTEKDLFNTTLQNNQSHTQPYLNLHLYTQQTSGILVKCL